MSELDLEENRISIDEEKILDFEECRNLSDDVKILSHFGKGRIWDDFKVICSPNMEKKKEECELKLDHLFDLKNINLMAPISVSDFENILIGNSLMLEIRNYENRKMKISNAQEDLKGIIDYSKFLKNGELVVVEGNPVYKVYIYSDNKNQWSCTDSIKLVEYKRMIISQERDGLNNNYTLLAVAGELNKKSEEQGEKSKVYFYSIKSGTMEAYDENDIDIMKFVILEKEEFLFVFFDRECLFYIINLRTFLKSKSSRNFDLLTENYFAIPGYIVRFNNRLQIESLSQNVEWKDDIHSEPGNDNKIDLRSYEEEIKDRIGNILETYKLSQDKVQVPQKEYYKGHLYTWIIDFVKRENALVARLTPKQSKTDEDIGSLVVNQASTSEFLLVGPELVEQDFSHEDMLHRYIYDISFLRLYRRDLIEISIQTKRVDFSVKCIKFIVEYSLNNIASLELISEDLLQKLAEIKKS
ncbi:9026_t:CDS:2 [Acaulospora morrowiae]|uniref:9026_t:CDS:1 n=1 Tax=Acaulospora morrowiae TaxID=94023 RepID=A0A9N8YPY4_9GLOM|nr:9026_t:CDS:2 [Acaulospora morrowiae]